MAEAWQTIEEAALTLGISTRTLHRRISKDEFQTRMNGGRREVLVRLPEIPLSAGMSDNGTGGGASADGVSAGFGQGMGGSAVSDRADAVDDMGRTTVQAKVSSTVAEGADDAESMLALTEDRLRRTDLAIFAYQQSVSTVTAEARRVRMSARIAWSAAGVLATVLLIVSLWATHRLTASEAQVVSVKEDIEQLKLDKASLSDMADSRLKELEKARQEAEAARIEAAQAKGALEATQISAQQSAIEAATWRSLVAGASTQPADGAQPASYEAGNAATQPTTNKPH